MIDTLNNLQRKMSFWNNRARVYDQLQNPGLDHSPERCNRMPAGERADRRYKGGNMRIGKLRNARTEICWSDKDTIEIWGENLCEDLIGKLSFTEFFYLLVSGRRPTSQQRFFLDALLIAVAEHGLTPTAQTARMTLAAAPDALQAAVAAGILGAGTVVLGTAELCGKLLVETAALIDGGTDEDEAVRQITQACFDRGEKLPGFGHPLHQPVDPRAERVIALAEERGVAGRHVAVIQKYRPVAEALWRRSLPLNLSGPIAAILLDLDFPLAMIKAIPLLARTAGLLGHLAEEQRDPMGFLLAYHAEQGVEVVRRSAEDASSSEKLTQRAEVTR